MIILLYDDKHLTPLPPRTSSLTDFGVDAIVTHTHTHTNRTPQQYKTNCLISVCLNSVLNLRRFVLITHQHETSQAVSTTDDVTIQTCTLNSDIKETKYTEIEPLSLSR